MGGSVGWHVNHSSHRVRTGFGLLLQEVEARKGRWRAPSGKSYNTCCKDGINGNQSWRRRYENHLVDQTLCLRKDAGTATAYRVLSTAYVFRGRKGAALPLPNWWNPNMLHYALVFLVIALIAAVFGFSGIAAGAAGIAQILFVVFLIFAVISFLVSLMRRS
jgi:uncharacterized membrane protein YtjA (UPF0391 family)